MNGSTMMGPSNASSGTTYVAHPSSSSSSTVASSSSSSSTTASSLSSASSSASSAAPTAPSAPPVSSMLDGRDLQSYSREDSSKIRDVKGEVEFRVVWNDGKPEHMIALICAKNIFAAQLPKMPKEYIARLVLDRNHRTMAIITKKGVIGGICFRPFFTQRFAEIVFCAITSTEQVKGYGTRIMNHLKEHVKTEGIEYFLTYADNYATGYFRKQGFTKNLTMPNERWKGWIKDYDGGTLMECKITQKVNYLDVMGMLAAQREAVYQRIKQVSNTHSVYPGLLFDNGKRKYEIEEIPGILAAGWVRPEKTSRMNDGTTDATAGGSSDAGSSSVPIVYDQRVELLAKLGAVLKAIRNIKDSWPFQGPVDRALVPDYYTIIKEPMDLKQMDQRLTNRYYVTREQFEHDFALVVNNCKQYNDRSTTYYKCACVIEDQFQRLMAKQFPPTL